MGRNPFFPVEKGVDREDTRARGVASGDLRVGLVRGARLGGGKGFMRVGPEGPLQQLGCVWSSVGRG